MTDAVAESTGDAPQSAPQRDTSKTQCSYVRRPCVAEEVVGSVVDKIMTEGGHLLWKHYLESKSFGFAVDAVTEAAVSRMQMNCVTHELGNDLDMEPDDWILEPEPMPCQKDSWMRMMLPARPQANTLATTCSSLGSKRGRKNTSSQKRQSIGKIKKDKSEEPRTWSLVDKSAADAEEERARDKKTQEDTRKREEARQKKEQAKAEEIERARVEELHKEMDQRPHTFDLNGNVLWVEQVNLAKLPKMQEVLTHSISKNRSTKEPSALAKTVVESKTPQKARNKKGAKKKKDEEEYVDGFTPLKHGQPPILDTMSMSPGVSLNHKGKSKRANSTAAPPGHMSRQEYVSLTQREVSGDTQIDFTSTGGVQAFGGNSGNSRDTSPKSPTAKGNGTGSSPTAAKGNGTGSPTSPPNETKGVETLPTINPGRPPPGATGTAPQPGANGPLLKGSGTAGVPGQSNVLPERNKENKPQPAPVAPPMHLRARKFDSVGHLGRPPRVHMPSMGKLDIFNPSPGTQAPPLGATMGHGLIRHTHTLEEYYFPPAIPDSPTSPHNMPRSKSDSALPKERFGGTRSPGDESPTYDGRILADSRSPAYRNLRKQLFPREP